MKKFICILLLLAFTGNSSYAANCGGGVTCAPGDTITSNYTFPSATYTLSSSNPAFIIGADSITIDASAATFQGTEGDFRPVNVSDSGGVKESGIVAFFADTRSNVTLTGGTYKNLSLIVQGITSATGCVIDGAYAERVAAPTGLFAVTDSVFVHPQTVRLPSGSSGNTFRYPANEATESYATDRVYGIYSSGLPSSRIIRDSISFDLTLVPQDGATSSSLTVSSLSGEDVTADIDGDDVTLTYTPEYYGLHAIYAVYQDSDSNAYYYKFQHIVGDTVSRTSPAIYLRGSIVADANDVAWWVSNLNIVTADGTTQESYGDDLSVGSSTAPSVNEKNDCLAWVQYILPTDDLVFGYLTAVEYHTTLHVLAGGQLYLGLTPQANFFTASTPSNFDNYLLLADVDATPTLFEGTWTLDVPFGMDGNADAYSLQLFVFKYMTAMFPYVTSTAADPSYVKLVYDVPAYPIPKTVGNGNLILTATTRGPHGRNYIFSVTNPTNAEITSTVSFEHTTGDSFFVSPGGCGATSIDAVDGVLTVPVTVAANTTSRWMVHPASRGGAQMSGSWFGEGVEVGGVSAYALTDVNSDYILDVNSDYIIAHD